MVRPILQKTPYEIYKGKKLIISYFKPFGFKYKILKNGKKNTNKFGSRSDERIFLGYSLNSRAYRIFNKKNLTMKKNSHVLFDESMPSLQTNMNNDDFDVENTTRKHD